MLAQPDGAHRDRAAGCFCTPPPAAETQLCRHLDSLLRRDPLLRAFVLGAFSRRALGPRKKAASHVPHVQAPSSAPPRSPHDAPLVFPTYSFSPSRQPNLLLPVPYLQTPNSGHHEEALPEEGQARRGPERQSAEPRLRLRPRLRFRLGIAPARPWVLRPGSVPRRKPPSRPVPPHGNAELSPSSCSPSSPGPEAYLRPGMPPYPRRDLQHVRREYRRRWLHAMRRARSGTLRRSVEGMERGSPQAAVRLPPI